MASRWRDCQGHRPKPAAPLLRILGFHVPLLGKSWGWGRPVQKASHFVDVLPAQQTKARLDSSSFVAVKTKWMGTFRWSLWWHSTFLPCFGAHWGLSEAYRKPQHRRNIQDVCTCLLGPANVTLANKEQEAVKQLKCYFLQRKLFIHADSQQSALEMWLLLFFSQSPLLPATMPDNVFLNESMVVDGIGSSVTWKTSLIIPQQDSNFKNQGLAFLIPHNTL